MSQPEFTPGLSDPEYEYRSPERALFDALQASYDDVPQQEQQFGDIMDRARVGLSAHDLQTINIAGGVMDSLLFGGYGEPLPTGLVKARRIGFEVDFPVEVIREDPAYFGQAASEQLFRDYNGPAMAHLLRQGLEDLVWHRRYQRNLQPNKERIMAATEVFVAAQPAFQLLQSFDIQDPAQVTERPLRAHEIDERSGRIVEELTRGLGELALDPGANQLIRSMARRPLSLLNQETVPSKAPTQRNTEPFLLADRFIKSIITKDDSINYLASEYSMDIEPNLPPNSFTVGLHPGDRSKLRVYFNAHPDEFWTIKLDRLANAIAKEVGPKDEYFKANSLIIKRAIGAIYEQTPKASWSSMSYDKVLERVKHEVCNSDQFDFVGETESNWDGWKIFCRTKGYQAPVWEYSDSSKIIPVLKPFVGVGAEVLHKTAYEASKGHKTGLVRIDERYADGKARMLYRDPFNGIPLPVDADNTVITVQEYEPDRSTVPRIEGYKTVSYDPATATYGFAPDPRGDIHAERCDVLLPPEGRMKAAADCEVMGLHEVAEYLYTTSNVTVAELAEALRNASRYVVPDNPRPVNLSTPKDLAELVEDDILQAQCTVSERLGSIVFGSIFGSENVVTREGKLINGSQLQELTAQYHRNNMLILNGREYPIDLTPSSESEVTRSTGRSVLRFFKLRARPVKRSPPEPSDSVHVTDAPHVSEERTYIDEAISAQRRTQETVDVFTHMVGGIVGARNSAELHRKLQSPNYYPIRQAFRLATSAQEGQLSPEAVAEYLTLLNNIQSPQLRRTAKAYGNYDPKLFDILRAHVHALPITNA